MCGSDTDPNEPASGNEASDSDENEDATDRVKDSGRSKQSRQSQKGVSGKTPHVVHYSMEGRRGSLNKNVGFGLILRVVLTITRRHCVSNSVYMLISKFATVTQTSIVGNILSTFIDSLS